MKIMTLFFAFFHDPYISPTPVVPFDGLSTKTSCPENPQSSPGQLTITNFIF